MSGDFRTIKYQDNNYLDRELRIPNLGSDNVVSAEAGAIIVLLDRVATQLEYLNEYLRSQK